MRSAYLVEARLRFPTKAQKDTIESWSQGPEVGAELTPSACDTEATLSVSTTVAGAHR